MFNKRNQRKEFDFMNIIIALNPGVKHPEYINDTNELDEQIELLQEAVKSTFYKMLIIVGVAFMAFLINKYKVNNLANQNIPNQSSQENNKALDNQEVGEIAETDSVVVNKDDFESYSWDTQVITSTNSIGVEVDPTFPVFSVNKENLILIDHKENFDIITTHTIGKDLKKPLIRSDKVKYLHADDKFITFINESNNKNYGDEFVFIDYSGNVIETIKPSDNPITISSYIIKNRDIYFTINNSSKLFKMNIDSKNIEEFQTNHSQEVVLSVINDKDIILREKNPFEAAFVLGLNSISYISLDLNDPTNINTIDRNLEEYPIWDNNNKYLLKINQNNNSYSLFIDDDLILNHFEYAKVANDKVFFIRDGLFQSFSINDKDNISTYDVEAEGIMDYYIYDEYILLITKHGDTMYNSYLDLVKIK